MASVAQTINRGVALLQEGNPVGAAALYRDVLRRSPEHPDAWHLLSVALYQLGDPTEAVRHAERAIRLLPSAADYHSNLGRYYLSLGRLAEALSSLDRALEIAPAHAQALLNRAIALGTARRWADALPLLERYLELRPNDHAGHHQLGLTLSELGRPAEAVPHLCRTVELQPDTPEAFNNLGNAMQALGQPRESIAFYEQALKLRPDYADAHTNLGAAWQALGDRDRAMACFNRALELAPGLIHARGNVANLMAAERRHDEAVAIFRAILAEAPESAETWNNLGNSYQELGRYEEAMSAYAKALEVNPAYYLVHNNIGNTLRRQGRAEEALEAYRRGLAAKPDFVEAMNNQAVALVDLGRIPEAVALYERAAALRPGYVDPLINLGNLHRDQGRPGAAAALFRRAAELEPANRFAWNNLGSALSDQGEVARAIAAFRRSLEILPEPHVQSNLLLNLHYTGEHSPAAIGELHRQWGRQFDERLASLRRPHDNVPDPDRGLRVGYVSADFRRHSVAFFIEPVVERHARSHFEVYCYADVARPDAVTARLSSLVGAGWRDLRGYNDERLAERVRQDRIDILVDLGGHTGASRLSAFAASAAPVQVTWLGYPNTTGMESVGYRLTDAAADPEGRAEQASWHSEELVRIPGGFLAFRPPAGAPPVGPPPALSGAPFTFGSFNNMAKLSDACVAAWAGILRRVPAARLAVKNKALSDEAARLRLRERFAAHGIAPDRLWMSGPIDSLAGHLHAYSFVDVALDSFPYNGTTTTCEALWMGVPVVTLTGEAHVSRVGLSVLTSAGLAEWAAPDRQAYIEMAVRAAAEPARLASLRASMRTRLEASSLLDEAGFTQRLETVYRVLWRRWCARQQRTGGRQ